MEEKELEAGQAMEKEQQTSTADRTFNLQVNYAIIQMMWKCHNKQGSIETELYDKIGLNKNSFSGIRKGEPPKMYRKWDKKNEMQHLKNLGLSREVMVGESLIEIDGINREEWEEYLEDTYYSNKEDEQAKERKKRFEKNLKKKLKKVEEGEDELGKLCYFCKHKSCAKPEDISELMHRLLKLLQGVSLNDMIVCDKNDLMEDVRRLLIERAREMDIILSYRRLTGKNK